MDSKYDPGILYLRKLSKAKAFGIHTNMYHFVNFDKLDQNYDWSFVWLEDNYNGKYKGSKN